MRQKMAGNFSVTDVTVSMHGRLETRVFGLLFFGELSGIKVDGSCYQDVLFEQQCRM